MPRQRPVDDGRRAALVLEIVVLGVGGDQARAGVDRQRGEADPRRPGQIAVGIGRPVVGVVGQKARQHRGAGLRVLLAVVADQADLQGVGRGREQLKPRAGVVIVLGLTAVEHVGHVAVVLGPGDRQAHRQLVADHRAADRGVALQIAVGPHAGVGADLGGEPGRVGGDHHRAGGGVLAEQGPLGAAQHLHRLHVGEVEHRLARAAQVDLVQVDADRRLQPVIVDRYVVPQPPDVDAGVARVGHRDRQAGRQLLEVAHVEGAAILERGAAEGGDGDRHGLGVLLTPTRGDDHGVDAGAGARLLVRGRGGRRQVGPLFRPAAGAQRRRPHQHGGEQGAARVR